MIGPIELTGCPKLVLHVLPTAELCGEAWRLEKLAVQGELAEGTPLACWVMGK